MNYGVVIERDTNSIRNGTESRTSNLEPNEEWMLILNELLRWVREEKGGLFRQMLLFEEGLGREATEDKRGKSDPHLD